MVTKSSLIVVVVIAVVITTIATVMASFAVVVLSAMAMVMAMDITTMSTVMKTMMITIFVVSMRLLPIGTQQGWRVGFFDDITGQSPQNDTNPTWVGLFRCRQSIDTMFPTNINVPSKGKDTVVGLGEIHSTRWVQFFLIIFILGIMLPMFRCGADKGQFPSSTKGNTDGNVLIFSSLRIKGGTVMVKGLQ
jgi:hypothetical protein